VLQLTRVVLLYRFACEEPVGLSVVPLLTYPEGLPPCPISAEVDDPVCENLMFECLNVSARWRAGFSEVKVNLQLVNQRLNLWLTVQCLSWIFLT